MAQVQAGETASNFRMRPFVPTAGNLDGISFRESPDAPLTYKGVVFNEMKGAMADPSSLLGRRLSAALFPTTCYGENSGGEPLVIPAPSKIKPLPKSVVKAGVSAKKHQPKTAANKICT